MQFSTRHVFECPAEVFLSEALYFHPDYHPGLYRELDFASYELLEHHRSGERIHERRLKRPRRELPAVARKALGLQGIEFHEEADYDLRARSYHVRVIPNVLPDKIRIEGDFRIEAVDAQRCARTVEMIVEVRLLGIGRVVERGILDDLQRSYDRAAAYTRRFWSEHAPQPGP